MLTVYASHGYTLIGVLFCWGVTCCVRFHIHVQYSYIMRFLVRHNRHHKVSCCPVGGHFVMSIVKCHESHYVGVLDNLPLSHPVLFAVVGSYCTKLKPVKV